MQPFAVRRVRIQTETLGASLAGEAQGSPFDVARERVVLLATDDHDFRAVAERELRREGYGVVTAAHAGHALLACLRASRVDVLVTELSMRDMSGPVLAQRIRRFYPDLPVVYVAGSGTAECDGLLARPFTRDDLVRQIDLALAGVVA